MKEAPKVVGKAHQRAATMVASMVEPLVVPWASTMADKSAHHWVDKTACLRAASMVLQWVDWWV